MPHRLPSARPAALMVRIAGLALVVTLSLVTVAGMTSAVAQDQPAVPSQDIVPQPNSGRPPEEAGDRGGALQLLILALMVTAIGGGGWHLTRQSRRARGGAPPPTAR